MRQRKRRFITQDVSDFRTQIRLIIEDTSLTELQRCQALNKLEMSAQRQYGFYGRSFHEVRQMCIEAQKTLLTDAQSLTGCIS